MAGELEFIPTDQDYVAAHRDWYRNRMRTRRARRAILSAPVGCAVGGAILGFVAGRSVDAALSSSLLCLALGLPLTLVIFSWSYLTMGPRGRQLYRQHKSLHQGCRYGWSEEGLSYRSPTATGSMPWGDLHGWTEGRHAFIFFVTENLFQFLPKRFFDADDADDLRATVIRCELRPR